MSSTESGGIFFDLDRWMDGWGLSIVGSGLVVVVGMDRQAAVQCLWNVSMIADSLAHFIVTSHSQPVGFADFTGKYGLYLQRVHEDKNCCIYWRYSEWRMAVASENAAGGGNGLCGNYLSHAKTIAYSGRMRTMPLMF